MSWKEKLWIIRIYVALSPLFLVLLVAPNLFSRPRPFVNWAVLVPVLSMALLMTISLACLLIWFITMAITMWRLSRSTLSNPRFYWVLLALLLPTSYPLLNGDHYVNEVCYVSCLLKSSGADCSALYF